jgi:hypothetical protein
MGVFATSGGHRGRKGGLQCSWVGRRRQCFSEQRAHEFSLKAAVRDHTSEQRGKMQGEAGV